MPWSAGPRSWESKYIFKKLLPIRRVQFTFHCPMADGYFSYIYIYIYIFFFLTIFTSYFQPDIGPTDVGPLTKTRSICYRCIAYYASSNRSEPNRATNHATMLFLFAYPFLSPFTVWSLINWLCERYDDGQGRKKVSENLAVGRTKIEVERIH